MVHTFVDECDAVAASTSKFVNRILTVSSGGWHSGSLCIHYVCTVISELTSVVDIIRHMFITGGFCSDISCQR